jgi:hypothetical protein
LAIDALRIARGEGGQAEAKSLTGRHRGGSGVPEPSTRLGRKRWRLENGPQRELPEIARGHRLRTEPSGPKQRGKPAKEHAAHMGD